jgi:hypothetical protein
MFRIDSFGTKATLETPQAVGGVVGYFTEGDPQTSTPATVVSSDWLNMVQEEIMNVVLAAGLTPSKTTRTQLRDSISAGVSDTTTEVALSNNVANQNITGMDFLGSGVRAVEIEYAIYRKTDTPTEVAAHGRFKLVYKPVANTWDLIGQAEDGDDCGIDFDVLQTGNDVQVRYTSSNLAGANYVGELRFKKKVFVI